MQLKNPKDEFNLKSEAYSNEEAFLIVKKYVQRNTSPRFTDTNFRENETVRAVPKVNLLEAGRTVDDLTAV